MANIKYPTGYASKPGFTKLAVNIPNDFFQEVIAAAKREKKTFNDMLIEFAKLGKFDLDESDALEPPKKRKRSQWNVIQ